MTAHRQSRRVSVALVLILAGLALVAGWTGSRYRTVRGCLDSGLAHARALEGVQDQGALTADGLAAADRHLRGLQSDLACLHDAGRPFLPLARYLGWLPGVGADVSALPDLLDMARAVTDGGVLALDAVSPLVAARPDLPGAIADLEQARAGLDASATALDHASAARGRLDAGRLSDRLRRMLTLSDRLLPALRGAVGAARLAPELLGSDGPRTYLILAQNDDERRPTGGWISGAGLVRAQRGQIELLSFRDSYAVDNLAVPHDAPPDSMLRTLWAELWLFRDSNWSPDFVTSAERAARILYRDQSVAVDGVIAVDQEALRRLVGAVEPLSLASVPEPVTAANLLPVLRRAWAEPSPGVSAAGDWDEWEAHRKDVMADLVQAMLAQAQGRSGRIDPVRVAGAVWHSLQERHLLIAVQHAQAAALLSAAHWDGALLPTPEAGDYVQVVDANVGFNKVDPNVERSIDLQVDLRRPEQAVARAAVTYRNVSPARDQDCRQEVEWHVTYDERMAGCFWNYVRFYIPAGARLIESGRLPLPAGSLLDRYRFAPAGDGGPWAEPAEQDKLAYGLFIVVAPGAEQAVSLEWQLAPGIVHRQRDGWHYRLLVQKQSGTPAIPLHVTALLPAGAELVGAEPEPAQAGAGRLSFDLDLTTDQQLEIVFRQP